MTVHFHNCPVTVNETILDWAAIVGIVAVAGFLWKLTRDVRDLETGLTGKINAVAERLAPIEVWIEGRFGAVQPGE